MVEYSACEGQGQYAEYEHDHADEGGHHGVVHDSSVEAHEFPAPFCGTEQPEAFQVLVVFFLVDGLPRRLQIGHVLLHPVVVDNLAARVDGTLAMVAVVAKVGARMGEGLPFQGAVAHGRGEGHGGAFAGVVELAAGDAGLGRGHVVVARVADRGGCAREEEGRWIDGVIVVVGCGRLHPR